MARKRKTTKKTSSSANGTTSKVGYTGNITVTLKNGNRIVSTHKYKNNGNINLWYFLAKSIAGQYAEAELYRPLRVVLYYCELPDAPSSSSSINLNSENFKRLTGEITANRATEVLPDKKAGQTVNWTATIHFLIPPAHFIKYEEPDIWINTAALYGKTEPRNITSSAESSGKNDYSAIYFFTKEDELGKPTNEWAINDDRVKIADIKENYNLVIDWQMSFDNQKN